MSDAKPSAATPGAGLTQKDYVDFLFKSYTELNNHARHQENLRSIVTTTVISLAAACLGVITFLVKDSASTIGRQGAFLWAVVLSGCVVGIGLFGAAFVLRASNRYARWRQAAVEFAEACNREFTATGFRSAADIFKAGVVRAEREFAEQASTQWTIRILKTITRADPSNTKTSIMWVRLMMAVSVLGIFLVALFLILACSVSSDPIPIPK